MEWIEVSGMEKSIILDLGKKQKSISEIAQSLGKSIAQTSVTLSRMEDLIIRHKDYIRDAKQYLINSGIECRAEGLSPVQEELKKETCFKLEEMKKLGPYKKAGPSPSSKRASFISDLSFGSFSSLS